MKNLFLGFSSRFLIHAFTDSGEALYDSSYIVVFTELRILFDHFTFNSLYFAISKNPLSFFILFSYPYLYKKLIK